MRAAPRGPGPTRHEWLGSPPGRRSGRKLPTHKRCAACRAGLRPSAFPPGFFGHSPSGPRPVALLPCCVRLGPGRPPPVSALPAPAGASSARCPVPSLCCGLGPLRLTALRSAVPSLRCGLPIRSPLLRLGLPLRSVRLAPSSRRAPFGAVGAGLVALLLGGGSGPGAVGGPAGRPLRPSAPGPFVLGLPPCAFVPCPAVLWWSAASPLRPSRPRRPRWGLRGSARPVGWASPPAARCGFLPPLLRLPPAGCARPVSGSGSG